MPALQTQISRNSDDAIVGNPVGVLQELCISKGWSLPIYELEHESGLPHDRQFTISCKALSCKEYGIGKSKKLAKRMAAHRMCRNLDAICSEERNKAEISTENKDNLVQQLMILVSFGIRNRRKIMLCSIFLMFIMSTLHHLLGYPSFGPLTNPDIL